VTAVAQTLRTDPTAWDAFVERAPTGAYQQLSAWARVKGSNGWRAERVVVDGPSGPVGLQLLVRDLRPTFWRIGYAPSGPVAERFDAPGLAGLTEALREVGRQKRLVEIIVDPEVEQGDPLLDHLAAAGWRPARAIQADRTRLVDLRMSEDELWGELRSKWRQYVSKARRAGVTVEDAGAAGLDAFYRIYVETARRAGFVHRAQRAYDDVFAAYDADGRARLLLARESDGTPAAALLLLSCGRRVIEPYGGMTEAGAATRANYLLKWEAIRSSRERGFETYDMWGVAHPGIERFKSGFGGREVRYAGGRTLVLDRIGHLATLAARRAAVAVARARHGLRGDSADRADGIPAAEGRGAP
jgi:lipid II:glycine glycyltransferase (peptidoglycan interpeptide bridge formation enzyme)